MGSMESRVVFMEETNLKTAGVLGTETKPYPDFRLVYSSLLSFHMQVA